MTTRPHSFRQTQGVAIFVVLGAIVLFALLGLAGISLAAQFAKNSGTMVDARSERMTATGGLNYAVATMQASHVTTVQLLNQFRQDASRPWLVLPASTAAAIVPTLSASKTWTEVASGGDQSAVAVKIISVGVPQADYVDITLESHGKGRSGDEFKVQATYRIHGVGLVNNVPTSGPTNALQSQGGIGGINTGSTIDGGLYSGGTGLTTLQSGATPGNWHNLRMKGDLLVSSNATIPNGSIINGSLSSNGGNLVVNGNFSVRGGITTFDKDLTVKGAFLLAGTNFPSSGFKGNLTVFDSFLVSDAFFNYAGNSSNHLSIGTGASSWAVFNKGFCHNPGGASIDNKINGRLFVSAPSMGNTNQIVGGVFTVSYNAFFDANFALVGGAMNLLGNAAFRNGGSLYTNAGNGAAMNVDGQSYFSQGIVSDAVNRTKTVKLSGDSYLVGSAPLPVQNNASAVVSFGANVSLNQYIYMYSANKWKLTGTSQRVSFSDNAGGHSFNATAPSILSTYFSGGSANVFASRPDTALPGWPWLGTSTPTMTETSLGFSTADQKLDPGDNPISKIDWGQIPKAYQDYAKWDNLVKTYGGPLNGNLGTCNISTSGEAPSGTQLDCIYAAEKADNHLYNGYLLVDVDSWLDNPGAQYFANSTLSAGTKIFFEIRSPANVRLYQGNVGSVQIYEIWKFGGTIFTTGSFYGFVQIHSTPGSGQQVQLQPSATGTTWAGSLEMDGDKTLVQQSDAFTISNLSPAAKNVIQDIANAFSAGVKPVIKFNGDASSGTLTAVPSVTAPDGWVQFQRLGEFR